VLYLYAITEPLSPLDGVIGVRGASPRFVRAGGLAAVVSGFDMTSSELGEDEMWAHDRVVEAVMDRAPVLPMRLGSLLADDAAVRNVLRQRGREWAEGLERVRGAVELGIRAAIEVETTHQPPPEGAQVAEGSGAAYLLGRLAAERSRQGAARRVHEPLVQLARDSRVRIDPGGLARFRASYLVDRARLEAFKRAVEELRREPATSSITCTGPWPPYSFTGSEARR
jgi:hypothetical protein